MRRVDKGAKRRAHAFPAIQWRGLRCAQPTLQFVTAGLDPVVHADWTAASVGRMSEATSGANLKAVPASRFAYASYICYNSNMNEGLELHDYDDLKRRVSAAIRATFQELADENGVSFYDYVDDLFRRFKESSASKE
jgi:hypothetical protein